MQEYYLMLRGTLSGQYLKELSLYKRPKSDIGLCVLVNMYENHAYSTLRMSKIRLCCILQGTFGMALNQTCNRFLEFLYLPQSRRVRKEVYFLKIFNLCVLCVLAVRYIFFLP